MSIARPRSRKKGVRPCGSSIPNRYSVGARGYLCTQNYFLLMFRIPPVIMQAPIVFRVNLMLIQDLTICTQLVPL